MFFRGQTVGKYRIVSTLGSGGFGAVFLFDARMPKLLGQSPLAVATGAERPRLRQRICRIVDEAELCKAVRKLLEIRGGAAVPAALAQLAGEIGAELRPRRRIFADIAKREFPKLLGVQRRRRSACLVRWPHA